ncbi:lysophospholipid acyltransferase family protein [Anaerosporobacter sp.]|uniref:lysophospholipid acyltransferase family protein n=1 Tax=Anaerosporobacter sp. TaxID=1872529 RepID=UPI00286F7F0D|nr:lysophospholipid acyltransferase family protein [Anaerosporobacter sp.]
MKTLFVGLFLLIFFIISIPLLFIEFLIGKFDKQLKVRSSQKIVVTAFKMMLAGCGVKKTILGLENIPKDQAVLYVANHRSYFDILVGYTSVPTLTGFVAKKEMRKLPFISSWMKNLHCLFLDRDNIREGMKTILEGIDLVKHGHSIFIAPEGTRNQGTEMLPFKEGSFKIAEKSGCPIIPVSMNNTDGIFEQHLPWVRKGHVIVEFGEPIYLKELSAEDRKHLAPYVQGIIKDTLEKNKSLV